MAKNRSRGFTLAEVMISVGLLGILSFSLMSNLSTVTGISKQTKQENIISSTTKMVQTILNKAESTSATNNKNCQAILTPGGVLATSLSTNKFVTNQNLGDGVRLESISLNQEPTTNNRIPITISLNYSKKVSKRTINLVQKIQTYVVNDNGSYKCINYDGKQIESSALATSCAIIDISGNCSFSDFTIQFKKSLNRIICQALGATNATYAGNTLCNQININRKIHSANISLTGNSILAEDQICVGAECRKKLDNTQCPTSSGLPQFMAQMDVSGKSKTCSKPVFNYIAP